MALQTNGAISMNDIRTEFGDTGSIALSECYKGGGIVPATIAEQATVANNSYNSTNSGRNIDFFYWNTNSRLVYYRLWSDNGAANTQNVYFTINKSGTFNINYTLYYGGFGNTGTATIQLTVDGTQVFDSTVASNDSPNTVSHSFNYTAGDEIHAYMSGPSAGWSYTSMQIGGDAADTRTVTVSANANVPTSGTIDLNDFYGATNS
jgi:hypothetical protein